MSVKLVILLVNLIGVVLWFSVIADAFNFPGQSDSGPGVDLTKQATTNTTTSIVTPAIVTPTNSCICVAVNQCNFTSTGSTDGSGIIDIRIVDTITGPTTAPTTLAPGVTVAVQPNLLVATAFQTTCLNDLRLCCYPGSFQCGIRYPPVAGAQAPTPGQAAFGAYPWQAVLLAPGDVYSGSGALIDNLHILTAAHRITAFTSGVQLRVRLGEWDASNTREPLPAQEQVVSRIFIHPNFNPNNLKNDVAILRLTTPINLGQYPTISTICLPTTTYVGNRCFVSGWGKNDFSNAGTYQAIQKEVDVPVLDNPTCEARLRATRLGAAFSFDTASFMCAGGEAGKDACTGDGGSPLVCRVGDRYQIAGLVAWGIGCATGGVPGVYVNVATFVPWIQTTVRS